MPGADAFPSIDPYAVTVDVLNPNEAPFPAAEAPQPEPIGLEEPLPPAPVVEVAPPPNVTPEGPAQAQVAVEARVEALPEPAPLPPPEAKAKEEAEPEVKVDFERTDVDLVPPPVKRVQLSNQMDILAELEGLRKQATMQPVGAKKPVAPGKPALDLDALLGTPPAPTAPRVRQKELRRQLSNTLNSDVFKRMNSLQVAVHIQNSKGETVYTLEPVSVLVGKAGDLEKLSLQLLVELENKR